ncbi:MAG TPA: S8 family peptidase [Chryseosolibacter sp.]|nr:S8 family peptidase [Chryseosolibacter sp.]
MALNRKVVLIAFVCFFSIASRAQVNRYMVFFKDKNGSLFDVARPYEFLSQKSILRRINQGIEVTEQDLPVNESYVQDVRQTGAEVYYKSRWFNAILVQCDQSLLSGIEALTFVDHVEFVAPGQKLVQQGRKKFNLKRNNTSVSHITATQLNLIGINYMHQADYHGEGMTIAVMDAGFQGVDSTTPFAHLITNNQLNTTVSFDFVYNTDNVFQYDEHGTEVLSVIAAEIPDEFTGGASKASFQLYVTEDVTSEYRVEEYNWAFAAERADSAGVDIINTSLGYYDFDDPEMNYEKADMDGETATITRAAQWAADRGIIVVTSAGNEGNISSWRIITAPADARDVIAVASVDAGGVRASSSSIGPSADGRTKPDLAAMGVGVKVVRSSGSVSSASGTSLAAPLITALVAGVWQRYPELTNKEVIELLKKSASLANNPNNLVGYGLPNFRAVVNFQEPIEQVALFEVYPNRVVDTIVVTPKDPDLVESCFIELIAANGQVLSSSEVSFTWFNRTYQTSLATLAPGMYFLRVWFEKKRFVFKVVKE